MSLLQENRAELNAVATALLEPERDERRPTGPSRRSAYQSASTTLAPMRLPYDAMAQLCVQTRDLRVRMSRLPCAARLVRL